MIMLRTLGDVCLIRGSTPVRLPKKCAALLAFICAARNRSVTRAEAMLLLWENVSDRAARHSLNQALYTLRQHLGPRAISGTQSLVSVATVVKADFLDLFHAIDSGHTEAIRRLAQGRFFEGVMFDDAPEFATWRDSRAALLERKLSAWYQVESETAFGDEDVERAEQIAAEGIARFPQATQLHLGFIRALLKQRKVPAARAAYSAFQHNVDELNASQSPQWEEIAESIGQPFPTGNAGHSQHFVGRERETNTIRNRWRLAVSGTGGALLIRGKPGIGKTYLCDECVHILRPGRLFQATAYEGEQRVGFSLLGALLRGRLTREDLAGLTPVMRFALQYIAPDVEFDPAISEWHRLGQEAGEWRIFEASTRLLVAISRRQPVLVMVDNVQWADDASRAWIEHLSRNIAGERILLLATCRSNTDSASPLQCHNEITLGDFDQDEVRTVLTRITGRVLASKTVDEVMKMTGGHPLFTTALGLRLKEDLPLELPEINARVEQLSIEARRIVDLLAVLARPLEVHDLVSLSGVEMSALLACIRSMSDLCAVRVDGMIELVHDLVRIAVYDQLTEFARRHYHAQAACHLEQSTETVGLAAQHWFEAGNKTKTTRLALQAAAESESKHAAGAAYHFYELAMRTEEPPRRQQIKIRLAEVLFQSGQYEMALEPLNELVRECGVDPASLTWRWKLLYSRVAMRTSEPEDLVREARELEKAAEQCGHGEALYHAIRAQLVVQSWLLVDHTFVRHKERLIDLSDQYSRSRLGAMVLRFVAEHVAMAEDAEKGLAHAQTACDWAKLVGEPELIIVCLRTLALAQYLSGRVGDSRSTLGAALEITERSGALLYRAPIASKLVCVLAELDATDEATRYLKDTMAKCQWDGNDYVLAMANKAVLQFNNNMFAECIETTNSTLDRGTIGSWLEISIRGLRGLCLVQLGALREASQEAGALRTSLEDGAVIAGDISYALMLIGRVAALHRKEAEVELFVREKLAQYSCRDFVCRLRLQLALADVLTRKAQDEANRLASSVLNEAKNRGLKAVMDQALTSLRRIRRKAPYGRFVQLGTST